MWIKTLPLDLCCSRLLIFFSSQSKLSQEQLNQLQKDTRFDKKELQQWYKGTFLTPILAMLWSLIKLGGLHRFHQGLPGWHAHQGRVSENL